VGYSTDFVGEFRFSRGLTLAEKVILDDVNERDWRYDKSRPVEDAYWCQWIPNRQGTALEWDGGEKFYNYIEWLKWLIERYFKPWQISLNGEVLWQGEDREDMGKIIVKDNIVTIKHVRITYEEVD